jgi:hypothetical protein
MATETLQQTPSPDAELKARHRAMWASGDYPSMVETFLLPLGPRLVEACAIAPGTHVLDVAAGTGNASIPAAQRGASVTASVLTPELLDERRLADPGLPGDDDAPGVPRVGIAVWRILRSPSRSSSSTRRRA